ncbi:hypothetical protein [Erysipelothrix anatis]|uniref:hypothetical protein n=1 Tax=Erysipelothrix anatis TaxID=2683713 RepID=UPI0013567A68|nr:hypothetical protein [Erysipelothrix anatis]
MKQSATQKAKIIFGYTVYGLGIGGIVSLILVLTKKIPDKFEQIMAVALPIAIIYITYKVIKTFNTIELEDDSVCIRTIFGKMHTFTRNDSEFYGNIGGFTIYQQQFAPLLYLTIVQKSNGTQRRFPLAGYDQIAIDRIESVLFDVIDQKKDHYS